MVGGSSPPGRARKTVDERASLGALGTQSASCVEAVFHGPAQRSAASIEIEF